MARVSRAADKAKEKAERLLPGEIVIRVQATGDTLERLWALMIYAEAPFVRKQLDAVTLPWEEPQDPPPGPALEIDYEAVRRAIVKQAKRINNPEKVKAAVNTYAETFATLKEDDLIRLLATLEGL